MGITASWISAFSDVSMALTNGIMALMAICGYFLAKDWKREATAGIAIGHCTKILSDCLPDIQRQIYVTIHEDTFKNLLKVVDKSDSVNIKMLKDISRLSETYLTIITTRHRQYSELVSEYYRLNHLSWAVKAERKEIFNSILNNFSTVNNKEYELNLMLKVFVCGHGLPFDGKDPIKIEGKEDKDTVLLTGKDKATIVQAILLVDKITDLKKQLQRNFGDLDINAISIFDLFGLKK